MNKNALAALPAILFALMTGCAAAPAGHPEGPAEKATTVGLVQKEIKVGMSGAEVAQVLGSPNVVTTDEKRREVWVYDKVSTDSATTKTESGVFLLLINASSSSASRSTTQRTLTIIIKFDEKGLVRDFAYNASKF
jgi:outer membrane protein assembly factor BamE (lipoprotein component of BamABCDE complex)